MKYQVRLRSSAQKELDALSEKEYEAVAKAISDLGQNPRPPRVKKLGESGLWRVRVGRLRVVFAINDLGHVVTVVRVARRREDTYRGL